MDGLRPMHETTTTDSRNTTEFLATARARFTYAAAQEAEIRSEARIDLTYLAGDQWSKDARKQREEENRPCLTFNKLPTFVQSVANECRQNKPQPKVNPVAGGATAATAKVLNGIIRHVQYRSKADIAYDTALEYSASCSFGYFGFRTTFCYPNSFEQDLEIETIHDPFSVYGVMIPHCLGRKPEYAFRVNRISKDEHKRLYPHAKATTLNFEGDTFQTAGEWFGDEDVQIAEYWYTEKTARTLQKLSTGGTRYADEGELPEGVRVVMSRTVTETHVKQCLTNGSTSSTRPTG
jgi:hypothetical protein